MTLPKQEIADVLSKVKNAHNSDVTVSDVAGENSELFVNKIKKIYTYFQLVQ